MDSGTFDALARTLAGTHARRRLLAGLAIAAATTALGRVTASAKPEGPPAPGRPGGGRVTVCHKGRTKTFPPAALAAHLGHGDTEGACSGTGPGAPTPRDCTHVLAPAGCTLGSDGVSIVWTCPRNTDLSGKDLSRCNLIGANLRQVFLTNADLREATLNNARLDGSQAHGADFGSFNNSDGATMVQATFRGTNLGGADFLKTDMREGDFTGASLNGARLVGAETQGAVFQDADLRGVKWQDARCPDGHYVYSGNCCGYLDGFTTPYCG